MNNEINDRNAFNELLKILHEEDLIRLRRRAFRAGNDWLERLLINEIEIRFDSKITAKTEIENEI